MTQMPSSTAKKNLRIMNEIGMAIDHVIVRIKQNKKLKMIFSIDIRYDSRTAYERARYAITWQPDGKAHFRLTNWLNETVYQFVLEQE